MNFIGIIPARYASTRFPGKPLALIGHKPMIQWVYENALKADVLSKLVIATDDERIANKVKGFGGEALMTADSHHSGTDRCFEAATQMGIHPASTDVIINIQGDEPFIDPIIISQLASAFSDPDVQIATLVKPFDHDDDLFSDTCMKVVCDKNRNALYFSRSIVPFIRSRRNDQALCKQFPFLQHIGIYAYRMNVLSQLTQLEPSLLEKTESLEQLRWLENGYHIRVVTSEYKGHSVDIPNDIEKLKKLFPEKFITG